MAKHSTGIMGLSISNGCWLAQVQVDGKRHRRTFGKATDANARTAVAWMDSMRAQRTATLPAGTAAQVEVGAADAHARIDAWAKRRAKSVLTTSERMAAYRKSVAKKAKR